jgi:hypothetical protein
MGPGELAMANPQVDFQALEYRPPTARPILRQLRSSLPQALRANLYSARELVSAPDASSPAPLPTTVESLDRLLSGGLPRGRLVELTGGRSCGRFSTLLATLAAVTRAGESAVLVDLGNGLDPCGAEGMGVVLEQLLWIRPSRLKEALLSTESVLHTGFPLVILDLGNPPIRGGRGAEAAWLRLARAAESRQTALLVSSPYRVSGTAATVVLKAQRTRPLWRGRGFSPRLLTGLLGRFYLKKSRLHPQERNGSFQFIAPAARVCTEPRQQIRAGTAS